MSDQISQISQITDDRPVRFTVKQRLFIGFYLGAADFNAAEAARLAGYSLKTAREIGSENLRKPHIAREIERRLDEMGLSAGEILSRLGRMARGEHPTRTVNKDGKVEQIYDERQALENLARAQGLFVDRHQVQAVQGLLIEDGD